MQNVEYKVVPAPARGQKAKGVKTTGDKFASVIETTLNDYAADGWTFLRAEILPCEERSGLTGRVTTYQNLLVFQRIVTESSDIPVVDEHPVHVIAHTQEEHAEHHAVTQEEPIEYDQDSEENR